MNCLQRNWNVNVFRNNILFEHLGACQCMQQYALMIHAATLYILFIRLCFIRRFGEYHFSL